MGAARLKLVAVSVICLGFASAPAPAQIKAPTDAALRKRLIRHVEQEKKAPGIVAGVIYEHGSRVFAYGAMEKGKTNRVGGDTIFEIGSITKVFTTLLLQDMADRGEVRLEDTIE